MLYYMLLIWAAAFFFGIVFGLANARISARLLFKDSNNIEEFSTGGAVIGGLSAFVTGGFFFCIGSARGYFVECTDDLFLVTIAFTLVLPALFASYRVLDSTLKKIKKAVDRIFSRQDE